MLSGGFTKRSALEQQQVHCLLLDQEISPMLWQISSISILIFCKFFEIIRSFCRVSIIRQLIPSVCHAPHEILSSQFSVKSMEECHHAIPKMHVEVCSGIKHIGGTILFTAHRNACHRRTWRLHMSAEHIF